MKSSNKNISFDFKGFEWSYSSLNMFERCPLAFALHYKQGFESLESAFTQYGKFVHNILEQYYKRKLDVFELKDEFIQKYPYEVTMEFPIVYGQDLGELYYDDALKYFSEFDDEFFDYEIVEIEKHFHTTIGDNKFVGIIDLILKNGEDYIIVDHKSKSSFKTKKEQCDYLKQLYLYSKYIIETYNKPPKYLCFNLVRGREIIYENFKTSRYEDVLKWANDIISSAKQQTGKVDDKISMLYQKKNKAIEEYIPGMDFFCSKLCGVRNVCIRSDAF